MRYVANVLLILLCGFFPSFSAHSSGSGLRTMNRHVTFCGTRGTNKTGVFWVMPSVLARLKLWSSYLSVNLVTVHYSFWDLPTKNEVLEKEVD